MRGIGTDDRQHREKRESWTGNLEKLQTDLMKEAKSTKGTEQKQPKKQEEKPGGCSTIKPKEKRLFQRSKERLREPNTEEMRPEKCPWDLATQGTHDPRRSVLVDCGARNQFRVGWGMSMK